MHNIEISTVAIFSAQYKNIERLRMPGPYIPSTSNIR